MNQSNPTKQDLRDQVISKQRLYAALLKTSSRSAELNKLSDEIGKLNLKIYGRR